jgi:transcriptional regulator with XRE-family HTH domain
MKEQIEAMLREGLSQAEIARRVGCSRQYVNQIRSEITIEKDPIDWSNTNILEAREAAGLSRTEMSQQFEIPMRTLGNWETGLRKPPIWAEKLIINELHRVASGRD